MRLLLPAGLALGLVVTACGKDSPTPTDFNDPVAVSSNLSSVDSAFDSDVFRSFSAATLNLDAALQASGLRAVTAILQTSRVKLARAGGRALLPGILQSQRLRAVIPTLSVAAAQGRIIPDSMYGRVFEWDSVGNQYTYQGGSVTQNGVRFVLYATDLGDQVVEPVIPIGTLDIIDESTLSKLQLHVSVKNSAGTTTYVDYTASLQPNGQTSVTETATGSISNGLSAGSNKTLTFDQTLTVNGGGASIHSTFALNNPAITLMLNESVTLGDQDFVINADFRVIQNGETIRTLARLTLNTLDVTTMANISVYVDGHPVASINGDLANPATQWVDAGGEPLTADDLEALDHLFDALENFQNAVGNMFLPISTLGGAGI
ncbi:MAG: hypothetical protein ABR537_10610 [Gemmatimonadales bacterium]